MDIQICLFSSSLEQVISGNMAVIDEVTNQDRLQSLKSSKSLLMAVEFFAK